MAEIKIEKKKPVWPWIVALLIIAALIYFVFFRDNEVKTETGVETENSTGENTSPQNNKDTGLNKNGLVSYENFVNSKQLHFA
jgi:hypothetical protein